MWIGKLARKNAAREELPIASSPDTRVTPECRLVPAIPTVVAEHCHGDRDARDKPGHDGKRKFVARRRALIRPRYRGARGISRLIAFTIPADHAATLLI
jgi:hypothetical protein